MDAQTENAASQMTANPPRRAAFALLLAGALCAGMGQTIVFSVLPPLAREAGLTNFQTGLIFAVSACCWVVSGPIWGRASDRRGRKPFILIGLIGFTISMIAFATSLRLGLAGALAGAPLWAFLVLARSLYGLLGSAGPPAAQAYIADRTSAEKRASGMAGFAAAFGLGAMLGPGFGAAAAVIGPVAPFFAMAALALTMAFAVYLFLPENRPPAERPAGPKVKLRDERLRPFLIFGLTFGVINSIPMQTIGFYFIDRLGFSIELAPQFVGVGLMGGAMASLFSQLVVVQRFGLPPGALMRIAPCMIIIGHALIWATADLGTVVFGMVIAGFGAGLAIPGYNAAASLAVAPEEQGAALGIANAVGASGFIISPFIGMTLYELSPQAPFFFTMMLAIALAGFAWAHPRIRNARAIQSELSDERPASAPYR
ncbi:MAG: MFS transporter [Pseudomonadota bacterium]